MATVRISNALERQTEDERRRYHRSSPTPGTLAGFRSAVQHATRCYVWSLVWGTEGVYVEVPKTALRRATYCDKGLKGTAMARARRPVCHKSYNDDGTFDLYVGK